MGGMTDRQRVELQFYKGFGFRYLAKDCYDRVYAFKRKPISECSVWISRTDEDGDSELVSNDFEIYKLVKDWDYYNLDKNEPTKIIQLLQDK